ncbi:hypothetical protein HN903_04450 [archaeon]|jgi:hypothetical protein|nr:hypothetical protein [archaeon]MBT7128978.1 hypothetical protein [archaeon]
MTNIKIIGAKFLEIEAKKDPDFSGKIELKTNIQISSLEKVKKSKDTLKITYFFEIDYGTLGKIKLKGNLFILSDPKTIKTIIKNKENNEYNTPEYINITNFIIQKASIKAFELEEELGLPIHIKLPTLSIKND